MADSEATDEDDAVWQTVSVTKTTKRRFTNSPEIFKHKNKILKNATAQNNNNDLPSTSNNMYAVLDTDNNKDNDDDDDDDHAETNNNDNEVTESKPPPIIIPNVSDIKTMLNNFSKIVSSNDFTYKSLRDGQVRLMAKSLKSYRVIVKYLDDKKIMFHTYQLKQERAYRVVIKNLHFSTPISLIKDELQSLGHQVRNIINIKSRLSKQPMSMFYVDLEPNQNNKNIFDIHHLFNAIVKIEPPIKTNDIIQCYRCQQFGHSKTYCRKMFNCVKCGLNHRTDNCSKPENTPPQCVNCLQHHTANYKGCSVYRDLLKKRNNIRSQIRNYHHASENFPTLNNYNTGNNFNNNTNHNNFSYAQAVKNNANAQQEQTIFKSFELFIQKQNELTNKLLNMMQLIMTKLCV